MSIADGHKTNLETLLAAAKNGDLALMECADAVTGQPVVALCAVSRTDSEYCFTPLAKFFDGNPYDELTPPDQLDPPQQKHLFND